MLFIIRPVAETRGGFNRSGSHSSVTRLFCLANVRLIKVTSAGKLDPVHFAHLLAGGEAANQFWILQVVSESCLLEHNADLFE